MSACICVTSSESASFRFGLLKAWLDCENKLTLFRPNCSDDEGEPDEEEEEEEDDDSDNSDGEENSDKCNEDDEDNDVGKENGIVGKEDSPEKPKSPVRRYHKYVELFLLV